jgi:hypothetical protein
MDKDTATYSALKIARMMQELGLDIQTDLCNCAIGGEFTGEGETLDGGKLKITVDFHPANLEEDGTPQLEKILGVRFSRSVEQMMGALTLSAIRLQSEVMDALSEMLNEEDDDGAFGSPYGNLYSDGPSNPYQRQSFIGRMFGNGN